MDSAVYSDSFRQLANIPANCLRYSQAYCLRHGVRTILHCEWNYKLSVCFFRLLGKENVKFAYLFCYMANFIVVCLDF